MAQAVQIGARRAWGVHVNREVSPVVEHMPLAIGRLNNDSAEMPWVLTVRIEEGSVKKVHRTTGGDNRIVGRVQYCGQARAPDFTI